MNMPSQPLCVFSHMAILGHLERFALLGTKNSPPEGLKWQGCDVFLHKHED